MAVKKKDKRDYWKYNELVARDINKKARQDKVFKIFGFLPNVLLAFGGVWVYVQAKKFITNMAVEDKTNQAQASANLNAGQNATMNPTTIASKKEQIRKRYPNIPSSKFDEIVAGSQAIAKALGTDASAHYPVAFMGVNLFDWYNNFTEDEETAVSWLKKFHGTFPALEVVYYSLHTKSRNLKNDLYQYLSEANIKEVRENHLPYKNI